MAESTTISLPNPELFKQQALFWANHFRVVCLLDSNKYNKDKYHTRAWVLAVDALEETCPQTEVFDALKKFHHKASAEIFGFISYDIKNELEHLKSGHENHSGFPLLYFFRPRYIFEIKGNKLTLNRNYPETFELLELISKIPDEFTENNKSTTPIQLKSRTGENEYLENVQAIRQQIEEGDYYELNYCNEFFAEEISIDPVHVFLKLNRQAQAPFSTFFKLQDSYLICASPERFLKKHGTQLISQPIKGTIQKGKSPEENEALMNKLRTDLKERAENVMIVDLVRNDLAKSSKPGTVAVEELFGVYEFNTVHQMISTIKSEIRADCHWTDAVRAAFPMGSMTGAPKVHVMKNIEQYEKFRRGLYSGSVMYVSPNSDFDSNVVIRSILYNARAGYLSVPVGGAITYDSKPEMEYAEMVLKAQAMFSALNASYE